MKLISPSTQRLACTSLLVVLCVEFSLMGCQMLDSALSRSRFSQNESAESRSSSFKIHKNLNPDTLHPDMVQLEVFLVERPIADPLLEKDGVWSELGFIGPLSDREKQSLEELGFRIGHSAANPPAKLEKLLNLGNERRQFQLTQSNTKVSSNLITLLSDSETELQTSPYYTHCRIDLPTKDGMTATEFSNARCVLKIKSQRIQDGWATLEILPEIQHGAMKWQAAPVVEGGWAGRTMQNEETLFNHRFSITLNLGEMVVIGFDAEASTSLGRHFFVGEDENSNMQRVIALRLVKLPKMKIERETFRANR